MTCDFIKAVFSKQLTVVLYIMLLVTCTSSGQETEKKTAVNESPIVDLTKESEVTSNHADDTSTVPLAGQLVEAETMNLTGHQVDNDESCTYIKLTNSTGVAQFTFSLPSGNYDIDVRYLSESAGQNTYVMYIANNQIVAWLGKDRDDQWHMLSEQKWHVPKQYCDPYW